MRRLLGFALPRTLASGLEQSIIWFDVVLVGVIAGSAAAGIYGAASRFVAAGVIVLTALRIVVAPRFSSQLAAGRVAEVQTLYTVTAGWILLFGTPIYVLLAVFSPTVLAWLGPDFGEGVPAMRILCIGAIMLLAGGNIQSLLLMSGRSGWGAFNKAVVFAVNVIGNFVLVPPFGITGAACAWALCMSLDTGLAMFQVYRFTRIRPALGRILLVLGIVVLTVGAPALVVVAILGNTTAGLLVAAVLAGLLVLAYCWIDGDRLRIDELRALVPSRRQREDARVTTR
jgi:O-antigen/teichoic acid export membrane protein